MESIHNSTSENAEPSKGGIIEFEKSPQIESKAIQDDSTVRIPMGKAINDNDNAIHDSLMSPLNEFSCEMCRNYESILTKLQDGERDLKEQLIAAQHLVERYKTELSGERQFRNELDTKMSSLSSEAGKETKIMDDVNEENQKNLAKLEERYESLYQLQRSKLQTLKEKLKFMDSEMQKMSKKYSKLCGVNRKCASEMQAQAIELPQDIDQLQFLCLQLREELIETRAIKEHIETELKDEVTMLQVQRKEDEIAKHRLAQALTDQVNGVSEELGLARSQLSSLHNVSEKAEEMERRMGDYRSFIEDLEKQIKSMQKDRSELEITLASYKQRCTALQQELDTSEAVQKDFVKLSQNLQIELEKIRQAEQEVRWQFDEDVFACNHCQSIFTKSRSKLHCQHCGKIFCSACLTFTVPSGPHRRLAKVCQVCHTLLSRDTAPFFSHTVHDSS
ncbi:unnamed protein product [Dracunculus medinensis]|uniref:FYVE-type domain-containing protein n=1 Tax=Dracunculus medinensis TaxID=318479 RepID=A0A0N4UF23_DRAME|nr:unnamed protein product [Dracunculus medinensis]